MADDKVPFDEYTFEPDLFAEDEVLQELERIIEESEMEVSGSGLETPAAVLLHEIQSSDEPPDSVDATALAERLSFTSETPPEADGACMVDEVMREVAPDPVPEHPTERLEEVIYAIDCALSETEPVPTEGYLTQPPVDAALHQEQYLVFSLAGTKYAVPAAEVVEIGRIPAVTPVPNTPTWLLGVTNRRGDILSVIDLRNFLGIDEKGQSESGRIVVVRSTNDEMMTGLIVDHVNGMLNLSPGGVQPPAGPIDTAMAPYLQGLCEHKSDLVAVLELELLLASSEMRQFELV